MAAGKYGEVNSVQDKVAIAQSMFKDLNDTDKLLRVDGGYLQGEMVSKSLDGTEVHYNSKTDANSITVAEARKIEIDKAQSTTLILNNILKDKNPRFIDPPSKPYGLGPGSRYQSGPFNGGAGWEYAGFKFYNTSGAKNMTWTSIGDVARAGDMADAWNQYHDPLGLYGIELQPGVSQGVYPTDGGIYTTYYSWLPASGSYYIAVGQ